MVAFAGYTVTSQKKYTFYDDVSVANTLPTATTDLCGEKLLYFQINSTETDFLTAVNSDFIYFSPPADTKDFGVSFTTLSATLKGYPAIKSSPISFTTVILGVVIPKIHDQVYKRGSSTLEILFSPFKILP